MFQYMPPTRGGNTLLITKHFIINVSIHAPHAGGQHIPAGAAVRIDQFQYMPPTRGGNLTV